MNTFGQSCTEVKAGTGPVVLHTPDKLGSDGAVAHTVTISNGRVRGARAVTLGRDRG